MLLTGVNGLKCDGKRYAIGLEDGTSIISKAIVIATGANYRRLPIHDLSRFEGAGIYYGATFVEAQLCSGEEVIVVGGGNSAGQAAVFLAQNTKHLYLLVRGFGLADSMSRYLIRRIEQTPNITLLCNTELVGLDGTGHLEQVMWRNNQTGGEEKKNIAHVFVMTGAKPNTGWLNRCVVLDGKGFIKTGPELSQEELIEARWPLTRRPYLLETSLPGVFAAGDVRAGNVKRVASAVGEGSISISFVHQALKE
jgi:thioredoxin reductase (NADPH)